MDAISELQVSSRFPDCVVMKLHLQESPDTSKTSSLLTSGNTKIATHPREIDLSLTINFSGEQEIEIPGGTRLGLLGGRATFGVRRGQLRFLFQNCKLPLEKIALSKPFKVSIEVEKQRTKSNEIQAGVALDTRNVGAKATEGLAEKVTVEVFQVKKIGSEDKPAWVFEAHGDRIVLEGTLKETLLGILQIADLPCEINADFTVRGDDVEITWGQIGQVKNINRNKLALIERAIALRYLKPMVEASPICQGRWQHG
ncbi:hypothetical protein H6F93_07355 [Leptolyngbya sp. FACHB-671]|uniref:hypothetical protein n=1 Tax=Leptolyngbya sp. FACHB-671 TaxID=2692812 RepID=UPI001683094C|nr:hypothetical protein [Leptolyngbya sp. FACHB-671]MBD2067346.1 hypothetical protein [Leptolyngbya sp. FACHB-671]